MEEFITEDMLISDKKTDIECEIINWLFQSNYYNMSFDDVIIKLGTLYNEDINTVKEICVNQLKNMENE